MKRFMKEISQKMCRSGWEGSGLCEFLKLFGEKEKRYPLLFKLSLWNFRFFVEK